MTNIQFGQNVPLDGWGQRLYFIGTDKLETGHVLTHPLPDDVEDVDESIDGMSDEIAAMGQARKPTTTTEHRFAGVVAPKSDGLEGKCNVRVVKRGWALVNVPTDADEGDLLKPADGSYEAEAADTTDDIAFIRMMEDEGATVSGKAWCLIDPFGTEIN